MNRVKVCMVLMILLAAQGLRAQQDYQFTQFNFNKLALNPAYAGSRDVTSFTGVYRNQWTGFEGAPKTISLSAHSPIVNNRLGMGVLFFNDKLGVTNRTGLYLSYAYRLPIKNSTLSMGLQAGILNYKEALNELDPLQSGDQLLAENINYFLPNFGFGVYWYNNRAYAGISVPHLVSSDLNRMGPDEAGSLDNLQQHVYIMGAYVFDLSRHVRVRPGLLFKIVAGADTGAPLDVDMNLSFQFVNKLWLGGAYRLGDSFDVMMEYQINPQLMAGYSYDFTVTELNNYNSGSHEFMLRYEFTFNKKSYVTPRFIEYN